MAIWQSNTSGLAIFSFSDSFSDKNRQVFACSIDFRQKSIVWIHCQNSQKKWPSHPIYGQSWVKCVIQGKKNKIIQNLSIKSQNMFSTSQPYLGRIWGVFVGPLQSRFICFIYFMDSQRSIPGADVHTCLTCAKEMAFNQL